jgi:hypothetical protein
VERTRDIFGAMVEHEVASHEVPEGLWRFTDGRDDNEMDSSSFAAQELVGWTGASNCWRNRLLSKALQHYSTQTRQTIKQNTC